MKPSSTDEVYPEDLYPKVAEKVIPKVTVNSEKVAENQIEVAEKVVNHQ